jgi:hypothetical protein
MRIVYHAYELASVSDVQAFDSEDDLLSHYFSLNTTSQSCAIVFDDFPQDGDIYDLKYKIRISNQQFFTTQLFPEFLIWPAYKGKTDNIYIYKKYII